MVSPYGIVCRLQPVMLQGAPGEKGILPVARSSTNFHGKSRSGINSTGKLKLAYPLSTCFLSASQRGPGCRYTTGRSVCPPLRPPVKKPVNPGGEHASGNGHPPGLFKTLPYQTNAAPGRRSPGSRNGHAGSSFPSGSTR